MRSGTPALRAGGDGHAEALLGLKAAGEQRVGADGARERATRTLRPGEAATWTLSAGSGAPSSRSRVSANSLGTIAASKAPPCGRAKATARRRRRAASRASAAAVVDHARQRVVGVAARALATRGEADPDGADCPVLVKMRDDARARFARRGERPPAERGLQVVSVDDARARASHGARDLIGREAAAQDPGRGAAATEQRRVAREQLGLLAEVLADQPQQVLDRALLAAALPVAVVEEEDHARANLHSP